MSIDSTAWYWPVARRLARSGWMSRLPRVRDALGDHAPYLRYYSDEILAGPGPRLGAMGKLFQRPAAFDLSGAVPGHQVVPWERLGRDDVPAYPPAFGLPELRAAVSERLRRSHGRVWDPQAEILITGGASHALQLTVDSFLNPGDAAVLFDPSYLFFAYLLDLKRVRSRWVASRMEDGFLRFEWMALEQALKGAKLLFLNSPANPTGALLRPEDLERIAWLAQRHDLLILSDEVYDQMTYGATAVSPAAFAPARTLVVNSFSKSFALAAYRVGYVAAPAGLLKPLQLQIVGKSAPVCRVSQRAALLCLGLPDSALDPARAELRAKRDWLAGELDRAGWPAPAPHAGFYFWVPLPPGHPSALAFAETLLAREDTLVMPGTDFGPSGDRHLRVSFVAPWDLLRDGWARLLRFSRQEAARPA
jgi:aminotransferase